MSPEEREILDRLVGPISEEQLKWIECFYSSRLALFVPVLGQCKLAITPEHSHPGFIALISADDIPMVGINVEKGKPGFQLRILPPGIKHQERPSDEHLRYYAIMMEPSWFSEIASAHGVDASRFHWEPLVASEKLLRLVRELMQECDLGSSHDIRNAFSLLIATEIVRCTKPDAGASLLSAHGSLRTVVEILEHRFAEPWTLAELARIACMSESSLLRSFRTTMQCSPVQYLLRIRVRRAQHLLRNGSTVSKTALATGFASASHLTEVFRKQIGLTPQQYRTKTLAL